MKSVTHGKSMLVIFYVMSYGGYGDDVAMKMMNI